jgi:hypothetical protein
MTNNNIEIPQQKAAKIAGLMFLIILIGSILYGTVILPKFIVADNPSLTVQNILANPFLFRIGILYEIFSSICGIILALTLYIMLKPVNKYIAKLAFCLKLVEVILVAIIALSSFFAYTILCSKRNLSIIQTEQFYTIIGLLFNVHFTIYAFPMLFLGINFTLFFYLLFKSKFVPEILSVFGIISYFLIFIFSIFIILFPQYVTMILQSIFWGPSVIFEFIIGIWFLVKKIDFRQ